MKPTRTVALVAGLILVAVGLWATFGARSFFDAVATFPPFNAHFLRDIGAFNLGLGTTLLAALRWNDAILVVLAGNAVGAAFHAGSHVVDADVSGPGTPILTVVFAVALIAAAMARGKEVAR